MKWTRQQRTKEREMPVVVVVHTSSNYWYIQMDPFGLYAKSILCVIHTKAMKLCLGWMPCLDPKCSAVGRMSLFVLHVCLVSLSPHCWILHGSKWRRGEKDDVTIQGVYYIHLRIQRQDLVERVRLLLVQSCCSFAWGKLGGCAPVSCPVHEREEHAIMW